MQDWQQRVVDEKGELSKKIFDLDAFLATKEFTSLRNVDRNTLLSQRSVMDTYRKILTTRIERFTVAS